MFGIQIAEIKPTKDQGQKRKRETNFDNGEAKRSREELLKFLMSEGEFSNAPMEEEGTQFFDHEEKEPTCSIGDVQLLGPERPEPAEFIDLSMVEIRNPTVYEFLTRNLENSDTIIRIMPDENFCGSA